MRTRREFMCDVGAAVALLSTAPSHSWAEVHSWAEALASVGPQRAEAFPSVVAQAFRPASSAFRGTLCFFSKHFPRMNAQQLGRTLKQLGFDGVDLTVRPGGHVLPARVVEDLPPFVTAVRQEGVAVPMITTELLSDADPAARPTLETAARLKIPYFKPGYYRYRFEDVRKELAAVRQQLSSLAALSARAGIRLGFHNHAGYIGGPILDIAPIIDGLDPATVGYYYDVRHAVVEGGDAGWRAAFNRIAPRLAMIALKDFYWEKAASGWRQRHCPMGEGMVDWKTFFSMLAKAQFHGPASLHLEYEVPGATPGAREENTIAAAARDLAFVKARIAEAYGENRS